MALIKNVELRYNEDNSYDTIVHIKTNIDMVEGLLGDDAKFKSDLLPTWVVGGMKFVATITNDTNLSELLSSLKSWLDDRGLDNTETDHYTGKYFVVGSDINVDQVSQENQYFSYQDDGGGDNPYSFEEGDWIVYEKYSNGNHYWGIVNNTYRDARENESGVIKLATSTEAKSGTNTTKAMTPARVNDYVINRLGNVDNTSDANKPISNATASALAEKQPLHEYLTKISDVSGSGLLKKDESNWVLDNTSYVKESDYLADKTDLVNISYLNDNFAPLVSPIFSGTPKINSDLIATTTFVESKNYITAAGAPVQSVNGKTGDVNLSKSDVGLGNVQNYGIASNAQAIAGTSSLNYMTPLRTKEAIDHFASIPLVTSLSGLPNVAGKLVLLQI